MLNLSLRRVYLLCKPVKDWDVKTCDCDSLVFHRSERFFIPSTAYLP